MCCLPHQECGIASLSKALVHRAGGGKDDLGRVEAVLADLVGGGTKITLSQYALFLEYFGSTLRCLDKVLPCCPTYPNVLLIPLLYPSFVTS